MPSSCFTYCFRVTVRPTNSKHNIIALKHPSFHGFCQFFGATMQQTYMRISAFNNFAIQL